ncbi:hypothetical protein HPO_11893 [Hyphomonas polymorpha PS728]|uniref:Uncharacterized protein n=1 Tax=Hyphomonas polymorpha PS728 TaxID=1280954 RepID=A0A062VHI1_9PROT|nr:hypothetical protein HPO_11893 [Hyphomonas polymorpha PS728]
MAARAARRDDHEIGERGFTLKVDQDQVFGFVVFEGFAERIGDRSDLFDRDAFRRLCAGGGG